MAEESAGRDGFWRWLFGNAAGDCSLRYGLLPLRLMIGVIFVVHGAQKAFGWFGGGGFSGTVEMLGGMDFPAPGLFALLLVLGELVGGILLIVGLVPRLGAVAIAIVMVVALLTAHRADGFLKTHQQQVILAGCLTMLITGVGRPALQRSSTPEPSVEQEDEE
jgi:putative oxidoreductase